MEAIPLQKRIRDMTWEDYGISKNKKLELKAFCRQYDEKKSKIKNDHPYKEKYLEDCRIIEEAAIKTNPAIWKYIIKSATQGVPYETVEYDSEYGKIPVCRKDFYGIMREFYYELEKIKMDHFFTGHAC